MCTDLLEATLLLNLFLGYYRIPKSEGGKFWRSGRAFADVKNVDESQKNSNPTIPLDRGQKTMQKSPKNHYLKISCF